jgi:hypothetical protein
MSEYRIVQPSIGTAFDADRRREAITEQEINQERNKEMM